MVTHQRATSTVAAAAAAHAPTRRNKPRVRWLGNFEDLPTSLQDNNYIRRGYRLGHSSYDVFCSLFSWHNETGNIYTHGLGFLLFLVLTIVTAWKVPAPFQAGSAVTAHLRQQLHKYQAGGFSDVGDYHLIRRLSQLEVEWESSLRDALTAGGGSLAQLPPLALKAAAALGGAVWPVPRWPLYVFMAGAMMCLLTSATCHLLSCCSPELNLLIWRFDYCGIAVLTVASFYAPVYYGFMQNPGALLFYLVSTTVLGLACTAVTLMEFFQSYRTLRAGTFVALGLYGVVPFVHAAMLNGSQPAVTAALKLDAAMGATYLGGAAIYALRIPERFKPGKFDYVFNSHQVFHVAVVAAALMHYHSVLHLIEWRDQTAVLQACSATASCAADLSGMT